MADRAREHVGRVFGPAHYEVGAEKVREFARVVGEDNPVYHDRLAAQAAGFRDLVVPPMFAVVYVVVPVIEGVLEVVGDAIPRMLHAAQRFEWHQPVCAGDVLISTATVSSVEDRDGRTFVVFLTETHRDTDQALVVSSLWTELVQGGLPDHATTGAAT